MNNDLISRSALLELKETCHSYYCSDSNFYVGGFQNFGRCEYEDWARFRATWIGNDDAYFDDDYNHLFRFDIAKKNDGGFMLWLFFILQRKGIFRSVLIRSITTHDLPEIEEFLRKRWEYMKNQWCEFSAAPAVDAEVVRHSMWLEHLGAQNTRYWTCLNCDTMGSPRWKRCPVCEAKMDMEVE